MSFWADQFVEVCYRARQFSLALNAVHTPHWSRIHWALIEKHLAVSRMHLECALAVYQLFRQKEIR